MMKAIVVSKDRKVEYKSVGEPLIDTKNHVKIKVEATGLCERFTKIDVGQKGL